MAVKRLIENIENDTYEKQLTNIFDNVYKNEIQELAEFVLEKLDRTLEDGEDIWSNKKELKNALSKMAENKLASEDNAFLLALLYNNLDISLLFEQFEPQERYIFKRNIVNDAMDYIKEKYLGTDDYI